jgi:hypothetical protein
MQWKPRDVTEHQVSPQVREQRVSLQEWASLLAHSAQQLAPQQ